jgi:hypothetical protein
MVAKDAVSLYVIVNRVENKDLLTGATQDIYVDVR